MRVRGTCDDDGGDDDNDDDDLTLFNEIYKHYNHFFNIFQ